MTSTREVRLDPKLAAIEPQLDEIRDLKQELLTGKTRPVSGRVPAMDLRVRQRRGRSAGHWQE